MSVYAIQAVEGGPIKIGFSANPEVRLAQLQAAHHAELVILYSFDAPQRFEARLHDWLKHLQVRGEWYRDDPEVLFCMRAVEVGQRLERLLHGTAQLAMEGLGPTFQRDAVVEHLAQYVGQIADALADVNESFLAFVLDSGGDPDTLRGLGARVAERADA